MYSVKITFPCSRPTPRTNRLPVLCQVQNGSNPSYVPSAPPKVAVIGAGWAGLGATYHLASQGYDVTLIDGSPNPAGISSKFVTKKGKQVEPGFKGFWYQYWNIFNLVEKELQIKDAFTPFTPSGFWSPQGLTIESPVFSELPRLPTVLGQFVHTLPLFRKLPLQDRATMFPLMISMLDVNSTDLTYEKYDKMNAKELFLKMGMSQRLYDEFILPLMLVGLFAPPEELSAASVIETFYFYTLAHQQDFDVKWCKGAIADRIFKPLKEKIISYGGKIKGGQFVVDANIENNEIKSISCKDIFTGATSLEDYDAVVFAISISGMKKLVQSCSQLAERSEFANVMNLESVDIVATRLYFDEQIKTQFPSNVLSGFSNSWGATFFNLNELQPGEFQNTGSVIAGDFYNARELLPLSEEEIVQKMREMVIACEPQFASAKLIDSMALKFPQSATKFSVGSFQYRPRPTTSLNNVYIAGDWVKDVPHGANGLSQERAYVTGLYAANQIVGKFGLGKQAEILNVEEDEPHVVLGRQVIKEVRQNLERVGLEGAFL
eukprot:TRINITY_DN9466_c0_g2_i7.p1 TRINITY_DN9466_c0_g2~~TRINITY_DN9466_c0_g2_i7.p1  ORF type:complete len:590 (+),score=61.68 TRINITY_DN9466_c0_g2_i7:127-1770(+)